jgi:hypothetical protein
VIGRARRDDPGLALVPVIWTQSGVWVQSGVWKRAVAVLAFGAALVLAGCETSGRATLEASGETVAGPPPPGDPGPASAGTPAQTREQTAALAVPPILNDDPRQLQGLSGKDLTALLGEPELIRKEGARGRDGIKTEPRPCLNGLLHRQLVAASAPEAAAKAADSAITNTP